MRLFLTKKSNVLIIHRIGCNKSLLMSKVIKDELSPICNVYIGDNNNINQPLFLNNNIDLLVCIGGDGTLLRCSSLFGSSSNNGTMNGPPPPPPILPISSGSLGFMLPNTMEEALKLIKSSSNGEIKLPIRWRKRLLVNNLYTALNEVSLIKRDDLVSFSATTTDGDNHLTIFKNILMDGLLVATPTGSTAHSLTIGGPLIHPSISGKIIIPIGAQSLSFRPLILPIEEVIKIIPQKRRIDIDGPFYDLLIDGKKVDLFDNDEIIITESPLPLPTIDIGMNWIKSLRDILGWSSPFVKR